MEVPVLGQDAARVREGVRQQEAPQVIEAVTAFLVCITPDGRYIMETDLDVPVTADRLPTRHEVIAACQVIASDTLRRTQTEELTMNILGNFSRMQTDPQYLSMVAMARAQAEAATAAANGRLVP